MQDQTELIPLFSKPIYICNIEDYTKLDTDHIIWCKNYNNWISESQNILGQPEFSTLAQKIGERISDYFYGVMGADDNIEIFFTESWLNKTESGQSHHRHWHPNSILSGVFYLENDDDAGAIRFITAQYETLEFKTKYSNIYNSKSWSYTPKAGNLVIFPSSVEHLVEEYKGSNPRISLSFNTFVRGNLNDLPLTRLSI
jgi:uncharacterized protein (TIGR02466 family)